MADIFISYASEDRSRVEPLARILADQGWSVWWDRTIPPGKSFDQVIQKAITAAKCVVVLWSEKSIISDWVKEEATIGKRRQILVPAKIDVVDPPLGFGLIQAADLTDWETEASHGGFAGFLSAISEIVGPSPLKEKKAEEKRLEEERRREQEKERKLRKAEQKKAEEEQQRKEEEELKRMAEEEERERKEADRKRKAEEEKHRKEQELKRKAEQERQRKEAEAKQKAEKEQKRKQAEEEEERHRKEEAANRKEMLSPDSVHTGASVTKSRSEDVRPASPKLIVLGLIIGAIILISIVLKVFQREEFIDQDTKPQNAAPTTVVPDTQRKLDQDTKPQNAAPTTVVPDTQRKLAPVQVIRDILKDGSEGPEMVVIPAGSFRMGDVQQVGEPWGKPVHEVRIKKPFAIGRFEVTFEEYDHYTAATRRRVPYDEGWGRGRRPVIVVSRGDAIRYAEWLSKQTGKHYRLPSEAEWEYAARGGTDTAYWWGKEMKEGMANCKGCGSAWGGKKTAPVGSFPANPFGLFDTAGNVSELVQDCWHENYSNSPKDGTAWLRENSGDCDRSVNRGGNFWDGPNWSSSSHRGYTIHAEERGTTLGFRLVTDLDQDVQ